MHSFFFYPFLILHTPLHSFNVHLPILSFHPPCSLFLTASMRMNSSRTEISLCLAFCSFICITPSSHPPLCCLAARLPPVRVEESSFSQDLQWLLERGAQFADVVFYAGDSGKELGWAHAAVLSAVSPYFKQLLVGRQAWERPMSRCACRERDSPHSLLSTWDGGLDELTRTDGHLPGQLSRLVVKDPLLCVCMWETLMFFYRGEHIHEIYTDRASPLSLSAHYEQRKCFVGAAWQIAAGAFFPFFITYIRDGFK